MPTDSIASGGSALTPSATTATTTEGAGSKSNNHQRNGDRNQQHYKKPTGKRFEGRVEELKGHVYDLTNPKETASTYATTTEEIAEYCGRTYKMGNFVK